MTTAHLEHISDQVSLVETVRDNEEGFTTREVAGARKARDAMRLIGFPSVKDFKGMVHGNIVCNCPVTEQDIKNWLTIYGPDIASLKGKSVRNASRAVVSDYIHVPRKIYERNKMVVLVADVMYISGIKLLVTVSKGINLITSEYLPTRSKGNLKEATARAIRLYHNKGMHWGMGSWTH